MPTGSSNAAITARMDLMPLPILQPWLAAVSYVGNRVAQRAAAVGAVGRTGFEGKPALLIVG
jgi:hypothetical protein